MKKQVVFENATISYHVHGLGRPVVLVHGFGETWNVWDQQVAALKENFKLIVPELPGTADSAAIHDPSMERLAQCIHSIVDAELVPGETVVLLGHSMGGYIALAFAEKYPELLASFGLVHSACFADSDEKKETRKKGISFIQKHGSTAFLESTAPNLFSPETKKNNPELINAFLGNLSVLPEASLIDFYEAMMARPDRSKVLKESKVPVLFILGKDDTAIPIKDGLRQTTYPELSYIHVLQHSGHMGMLEETAAVNQMIVDFLQSI